MPGNHSLELTLNLTEISNITFKKKDSNSTANIICANAGKVYCENVTDLKIQGLRFTIRQESALELVGCNFTFISDVIFQGSEVNTASALDLLKTQVTLLRCVFKDNSVNDNEVGGAIAMISAHITIRDSYFLNNRAHDSGGAIFGTRSTLLLDSTNFVNNSAKYKGGAIECINECYLNLTGNNIFHENHCTAQGGAIYLDFAHLALHGTAHFSRNKAIFGGAIFLYTTNTSVSGRVTLFRNSAERGGGMSVEKSCFIEFKAKNSVLIVMENEGSAVYVSKSSIIFSGNTRMANNIGVMGGGIAAEQSYIKIQAENCLFFNNSAKYGGAMNTLRGTVFFQGPTQFTCNIADRDGGALYASGTVIEIKGRVNFTSNSAENGGAMYFENGASMFLDAPNFDTHSLLSTSFNFAVEYGGGIYYEDSATFIQCSYEDGEGNLNTYTKLPDCFLQISYFIDLPAIISRNDSAKKNGDFLFGGLLSKCKNRNGYEYKLTGVSYISEHQIDTASVARRKEITSKPYRLCICKTFGTDIYCSTSRVIYTEVYRGQTFTVPLLARTQYGIASTTVTAITSATARLGTHQTSQRKTEYCHRLPYTVYSTETHEQVELYPDGPCRDTGLARVVIDVVLLPCPDGFTQSGEICTCDDRLYDYLINCTIADTPYLTKTADSNFWIGVSYNNTTYRGLILGKSCPAEYCKKGAVNITIDNPDMQCDLNRSGLLCGACAANHSLMLGSSQCQVCPNSYLALLLPFAAAGVALVVFLTCLRLTVATGTLNSVILYANILQVNRRLFFPQNTRNLLTVFLAWLNLDLGFQTCFYDRLDAYALTWLQFAFPLYVWLIIGLIIFISRYSITVSKLIGSNPIAVLATLLLMSYTKILKIIIEVYSYDNLGYPGNKTVSVWLKDANVPYLKSKHLFLTVVTSLILVVVFFPYTILLLLGHKLYYFTGKKYWHWLNRLKPLLDSYHAPYKISTRYWTGFLLLVRCALYIIFSLSSTSRSLLTITLTFSAIEFIISYFYSGRIYKNTLVNLVEASIYLNLIVLSATTLTGLNTAALVYSLVGLVFVTMIALCAYQFHLLYVVKTTLWLRLKNKWPRFRKKLSEDQISDDTPQNTINLSHDPHKVVTKTVIELREPLLDR